MLIREAFVKLDLEVKLLGIYTTCITRLFIQDIATVATFVILFNIVYKCTWPQEKLCFRHLHVASHTTRKHLHVVYFR